MIILTDVQWQRQVVKRFGKDRFLHIVLAFLRAFQRVPQSQRDDQLNRRIAPRAIVRLGDDDHGVVVLILSNRRNILGGRAITPSQLDQCFQQSYRHISRARVLATDERVHDHDARFFREFLAVQLILQLSRDDLRVGSASGKDAHQILQQAELFVFQIVHFVRPVGRGHDRSVRQIVDEREHIASN